jgi:hypothetical protein
MHVEATHRSWPKIAQTAVWVTALVFPFLATPPRLLIRRPDGVDVQALTQFTLAVIIALLLLAFRRLRRPRQRRLWTILGATMLACGIGGFFFYVYLVESWTCEYDGRGPVVIGSTYLSEVVEWAQKRGMNCQLIIQDFAGFAEQLWSRGEMILRYLIILLCYVATILMFSVSLLIALQLLGLRARQSSTARR